MSVEVPGFLTFDGCFYAQRERDWVRGDPVSVRAERIDSIGPISDTTMDGTQHTLLRVNGRNVRVWESPDEVRSAVQIDEVQSRL